MKSKTVTYVFLILGVIHGVVLAQRPLRNPEPRGLRLQCDAASPGYVLFAPMSSDTTYLVDLAGKAVRTWKSDLEPAAWVYLKDNGHLLRGGNDPGASGIHGGGQGGRFQEFDFDGTLLWEFKINDRILPHHDAAVLPNGNILAIVWETKTADEARRAGRREGFIPQDGIWPDMLVEFQPQPPNGARIVWEWHMWDHLIQNADSTRDNYGDPSRHPERIDVNGDMIGIPVPPANPVRDVFHTNSVAYNPGLDQIILSVPTFNEIWVIDHSTTSREARARTGGRAGMGGELLYRWGNPESYGRGTPDDRILGFQHDARWIPQGFPGAGHMMVFSNRTPGPNSTMTTVFELVPPVDANGRYAIPTNGPFGPARPTWSFSKPEDFQAPYIGGAERLANGNTLISSGPQGRLFEVAADGEIVWDYLSPYSGGVAGDIGGNTNANPFALFRALKISSDHPALKGRDLQPLDPQPPASPLALSISKVKTKLCPVDP